MNDEEMDLGVGYLFDFQGRIFGPNQEVKGYTPEDIKRHNELLDEMLLKGLDENCKVGQYGTFYLQETEKGLAVITWIGTHVAFAEQRTSRTIHFSRNRKKFLGYLQKDADCFNFKRIA